MERDRDNNKVIETVSFGFTSQQKLIWSNAFWGRRGKLIKHLCSVFLSHPSFSLGLCCNPLVRDKYYPTSIKKQRGSGKLRFCKFMSLAKFSRHDQLIVMQTHTGESACFQGAPALITTSSLTMEMWWQMLSSVHAEAWPLWQHSRHWALADGCLPVSWTQEEGIKQTTQNDLFDF